ncbi:MAG: hypothetical protein M3O29_05330 [Actinomycetota bacterium]|nr:hypothetical protein [Actinomycetota bacterium]
MATAIRSAITDARSSAIPPATVLPAPAGVWALGRIEARRMLLHPSFLVGLAFGLFILRGAVGSGETGVTVMENVRWLILGSFAGLLVATVLSTNVAALRPRRSGVRELFGSLPAPAETLTAGLFAGLLLGPVLIAVFLTAAGWWAFRGDPDIGPHLDLYLAVQVPLAVAALGTIGIAVGRWIPSLFGGPLVIVAHVFTPLLWAVPWILPSSEIGADGVGGHDVLVWHLTYLAAAITTWVVLAFARDRRTIWRFLIAGSAFALGIVAAFQQVPEGGW